MGRVIALVVGLTLALTAVTGCSSEDSDGSPKSNPPACGLLTSKTLHGLLGDARPMTLGAMTSRQARQQAAVHCQVYDADKPDQAIVWITVSDFKSAREAHSTAKRVQQRRRSVNGCTTLSRLRPEGYLCASRKQSVAEIVLPKRLIRVWTFGPRREMSKPEAAGLVREINDHIHRYDKTHGDS